MYATRQSSSLTAKEAQADVEEDHISLASRQHRSLPKRRIKDSDGGSLDQCYAKENTYRGGNVLGKGFFNDSVGFVRAHSKGSPGYDSQSSMAMHNAEVRTVFHKEIERYHLEHPRFYYVTSTYIIGVDLHPSCAIWSPSHHSHLVVHFSSIEDQADMSLPGMSNVPTSGGVGMVFPGGLCPSRYVPSLDPNATSPLLKVLRSPTSPPLLPL